MCAKYASPLQDRTGIFKPVPIVSIVAKCVLLRTNTKAFIANYPSRILATLTWVYTHANLDSLFCDTQRLQYSLHYSCAYNAIVVVVDST